MLETYCRLLRLWFLFFITAMVFPVCSAAYFGMLLSKREEVHISVNLLKKVHIRESIVHFATHMRKHPDGHVPRWVDSLGTVIIPAALITLDKKMAFLEHLKHMIEFEGCLFQRWCVYYGLPLCCLCEFRSPFYPPNYVYPLSEDDDGPSM